jgi:putative two-component system response regulator
MRVNGLTEQHFAYSSLGGKTESERPADLPKPRHSNGICVLVVDDEAGVRSLIRFALTREGFGVDTACTVAEARELLRTTAYDLVICDYDLPNESGLDLLLHLSQVHPDLPFILLTAHDNTQLARRAIALGALDYMTKPFDVHQLGRVIEQNLERFNTTRRHALKVTDEVLSGTIRALVAAVDAKDPHTATHTARVTRLALTLGRKIALSAEELRVLEFSALLHDVGKIGVPGHVLRKEGPLNDEEWAMIKQHPIGSAAIVSQVGQLSEVATIVRHHHERLDGTGYPDGLAGDAIPGLARLIAVADAYEAMTSDRAYRKAFTPSKAREIIHEELGRHFDEEMGTAFLAIHDLP